MSEPRPCNQKTNLALAIAQGTSVARWARANKFAKRTAYRWAKDPKVQEAVKAYRNRAVDRAIGRMAKNVTCAADGIIKLAQKAESESVKLSELRAILSDMMTISNYAGLERRMSQIEDQIRDQTVSTDCPS